MSDKKQSRYHQLIEKIFFDAYSKGATEILFERTALKDAAKVLDMVLPDNLGDVIYSMRFRTPMPAKVLATQPEGREWIIELVGRAKYRFRLAKENRIVPNPHLHGKFVLKTRAAKSVPRHFQIIKHQPHIHDQISHCFSNAF